MLPSCIRLNRLKKDLKRISNIPISIHPFFALDFTCIEIQIFDHISYCGLLKIKYQKYLLATPPARPERKSATEGVVEVLPNL